MAATSSGLPQDGVFSFEKDSERLVIVLVCVYCIIRELLESLSKKRKAFRESFKVCLRGTLFDFILFQYSSDQ